MHKTRIFPKSLRSVMRSYGWYIRTVRREGGDALRPFAQQRVDMTLVLTQTRDIERDDVLFVLLLLQCDENDI